MAVLLYEIKARRPTSVRRGEFALKIKTALPSQFHVEDRTGAAIRQNSPGGAIPADAQPRLEDSDRRR